MIRKAKENTSFSLCMISVIELSIIMNLNPNSLTKKANRQKWPFELLDKYRGRQQRLYFLDCLPDDMQTAWGQWDEKKYKNVIRNDSSSSGKYKSHQIPKPITIEQAKEALSWPDRISFFQPQKQTTEPRKGAPFKIYDGKSRGLCSKARKLLLKRFPQLDTTWPLQPELPERKDWLTKVALDRIERPSKICPQCNFGTYINKTRDLTWCPYCAGELLEECPKCGEKIFAPYTNYCTQCRKKLRTVFLPPPK